MPRDKQYREDSIPQDRVYQFVMEHTAELIDTILLAKSKAAGYTGVYSKLLLELPADDTKSKPELSIASSRHGLKLVLPKPNIVA